MQCPRKARNLPWDARGTVLSFASRDIQALRQPWDGFAADRKRVLRCRVAAAMVKPESVAGQQ